MMPVSSRMDTHAYVRSRQFIHMGSKNSTTNDVRKALIRVLDEKLSEATKKNN